MGVGGGGVWESNGEKGQTIVTEQLKKRNTFKYLHEHHLWGNEDNWEGEVADGELNWDSVMIETSSNSIGELWSYHGPSKLSWIRASLYVPELTTRSV